MYIGSKIQCKKQILHKDLSGLVRNKLLYMHAILIHIIWVFKWILKINMCNIVFFSRIN